MDRRDLAEIERFVFTLRALYARDHPTVARAADYIDVLADRVRELEADPVAVAAWNTRPAPDAITPEDVRRVIRPFLEGMMGRRGTVSAEEWEAAMDKIFPLRRAAPDGAVGLAAPDVCKIDGRPCIAGDADDRHHRCGTVQCGAFPAPDAEAARREAIEQAARVADKVAAECVLENPKGWTAGMRAKVAAVRRAAEAIARDIRALSPAQPEQEET